MADPLSLVASLIAVLQISGMIISCCYEYRNGLKGAPKNLSRLLSEVTSLRNVLERLIQLVDDEKISSHDYLALLRDMMSVNGPLSLCQDDLKILKVKLEKPVNEWKAVGKRLIWPLQEKDITKILEGIYRMKSTLESALMIDNTVSIIAIRETTRDLRERVLDFTRYLNENQLTPDMRFRVIMEWLNGPDQSIKHNEVREKREGHTGTWLLERKDYEDWRTRADIPLWLHGISGCGKTVLCSTIIEDVNKSQDLRQTSAVVYHYFDFANKGHSSVESLLRSLVTQLALQAPQVPAALKNLSRDKFSKTRYGQRIETQVEYIAQPSVNEFSELLQDMVEDFDHVFIILDALDECTERHKLLSLVKTWIARRTNKLHLLMTSRSDSDIDDYLTPIITTHILVQSMLIESDIRSYIREQFVSDYRLRKWPQGIRDRIEVALIDGAQGMFRWVSCQLEILCKCKMLKQLEGALNALPRDLVATYKRMLDTIDPESYEFAMKVFRWLTVSPRPIRLQEAVEIIAVDLHSPSGPHFDPDLRLLDPQDVLNICTNLVTISRVFVKDKEGVVVEEIQELHLAHFSVKEFLVMHFQEQIIPSAPVNMDSHAFVAQCCLVYLLQFQELLKDKKSVDLYPLARYAAQYWIYHLQNSNTTGSSAEKKLVLDLLDSNTYAFLNWRCLYDPDMPWRGIDMSTRTSPPPLYYVAQAGLKELVSILLEAGFKPNEGRGLFGTALQVAAYNGHYFVVEQLLSAGGLANGNASIASDPYNNRQCGIFVTPLKAAVANGHTDIVKLLLDNGAHPDITDWTSGTALFEAAKNQHSRITNLLLDAGADVNITGNRKVATTYGTNALGIASNNGALDIVSQLLPKANMKTIAIGLTAAASTNSKDMLRLYAEYVPDAVLYHATRLGWSDMVAILLQKGAATTYMLNVAYMDEDPPDSALREAASEGHESIVRELIASGANVNANSGKYTKHPLECAAAKCHNSIVDLLLKYGADVNTCGVDGTALQVAGYNASMATVKALLEYGADPDHADGSYGGPLQAAVIGNHRDPVQLLPENGANINLEPGEIRHSWGIQVSSNPLAAASHLGNEEMVEYLLGRGASVETNSRTALHLAAAGGFTSIVERLLAAGADVEAGYEDVTPLHYAVQGRHLAAAQQLLVAGANANSRGFESDTAPLHSALGNNDAKMLRLLIDHGADVNATDSKHGKNPETPLFTATNGNHLDLVTILLENGADINWQTEDGWTVSHLATREQPEILRLFCFDYQADLSLRLKNGSLPLHAAAASGNIECIEMLLDAGTDINSRNYFARTPLHYAAERGHADAIRLLVERGATVDIKEEEYWMTPLDYAKMEAAKSYAGANRRRCVEILEERVA